MIQLPMYSKLILFANKPTREIESYKTFRKQLKSFLLRHAFYSVEESVALLLCYSIAEVSFLHYRYSAQILFVICYSILLITYLSLCIFLAIDESTIICMIFRLINKLN